MASIPAILTSKFFHSGIALDENLPPGTPPRHQAGEHDAARDHEARRLSHRRDRARTSAGTTGASIRASTTTTTRSARRPIRSSSPPTRSPITRSRGSRASRATSGSCGRTTSIRTAATSRTPTSSTTARASPTSTTPSCKWTDQQIGRLLDELGACRATTDTIIIITSDHGESMGEHNVPRRHARHRALPRAAARADDLLRARTTSRAQIGGAVTNLDIVPTIAELAGIDVHDLSFEGKSLVPQLFYGKEDHDRIVFAETNAPAPQRAAISEAWKLIYYLQSNLYELYDLKADPWEKTNLAPKNPPAMATDEGGARRVARARRLRARSRRSTRRTSKITDVVLTAPPTPAGRDHGPDARRRQARDPRHRRRAGRAARAGAQGRHPRLLHGRSSARRSPTSSCSRLAGRRAWKPTDPAPPTMRARRCGRPPTASSRPTAGAPASTSATGSRSRSRRLARQRSPSAWSPTDSGTTAMRPRANAANTIDRSGDPPPRPGSSGSAKP